jgi:leucyl aminopeptidase
MAEHSNFSDLFEAVCNIDLEDNMDKKGLQEKKEILEEKEEIEEKKEILEEKEEKEEIEKEDDPKAKNAMLVILGRADGVKEDQVHSVLQAIADAQDDELIMSAINSLRGEAVETVPDVDNDTEEEEIPEEEEEIPEEEEEIPEEEEEIPEEEE